MTTERSADTSGGTKTPLFNAGIELSIGMAVILVPKLLGFDTLVRLYVPTLIRMVSASDLPFRGVFRWGFVLLELLFFELFPLVVLWFFVGIFMVYESLTLVGESASEGNLRRVKRVKMIAQVISILFLIYVFV